jgi:hypothetical protein
LLVPPVQSGEEAPVFDMRRREFITLLGGATVAWPLMARAQQSKARIGALYVGTADAESFKEELRAGLRELGYVEEQNIAFEFRSAEGQLDRLPELATELVALKVDVIVALYTPSALAVQRATREMPIVVLAGDPVRLGLVTSLARPGGNITGISLMAVDLSRNASNSSAMRFRGYAASPLSATTPDPRSMMRLAILTSMASPRFGRYAGGHIGSHPRCGAQLRAAAGAAAREH